GTMLQDTTDPDLVRRFRRSVVAPRRKRLRAILDRAVADGLVDADADVAGAVPLLTGSWYARALAGDPVPRGWAHRTASLVWRALGGTPPSHGCAPRRAGERAGARRLSVGVRAAHSGRLLDADPLGGARRTRRGVGRVWRAGGPVR